jgi:hypothetical protein
MSSAKERATRHRHPPPIRSHPPPIRSYPSLGHGDPYRTDTKNCSSNRTLFRNTKTSLTRNFVTVW